MYTLLQKEPPTVIVSLHGELDNFTVPEVEKIVHTFLLDPLYSKIILNCKEVTYMGSAGIGMLLNGYRQAKQEKKWLILCDVSTAMEDLFSIAGVERVLLICTTEEEARKWNTPLE